MKIAEAVAGKIAGAGEKVFETVVEKLASAEINRRVEVVQKAVEKAEALKKDLAKINRPDSAHYSGGQKVEVMTEKRFNEIDKIKKHIERIENGITVALEKNTEDAYKKLAEATGGQQKQEEKAEE